MPYVQTVPNGDLKGWYGITQFNTAPGYENPFIWLFETLAELRDTVAKYEPSLLEVVNNYVDKL